jgi:hypothetical protein
MTEQSRTDPSDTGHLAGAQRITLDEVAVHLSAAAVWLRQVARAAETPQPPVELADLIASLSSTADQLDRHSAQMTGLHTVITDEVLLSTEFLGGKPWGAAVANAAPDRYGPPPTILTPAQIDHLRQQARWNPDAPTTNYLAGISGVPGLDRFESKTAHARRAIERERAITAAALTVPCPTCQAEPGNGCRTKTGRLAETRHAARTKHATELIDHPAVLDL